MMQLKRTTARVVLAGLLCGVAAAQEQESADADIAALTNPALRAILSAPRETPADYARAVFVLIDLGETERALPIVDELAAQAVDAPAKASLVEAFGSAKFARLMRVAGSGSTAAAFAASCLEAANAQAVAPERMEGLIKRLGSETPSARTAALAQLKRTGLAGVRYCLARIGDAGAGEQNRLREALVALAPQSAPALLGMLDSSDDDLRKQAAWALGKIGDAAAAPLLAARAVLEPAGSDSGRAAQWAFVEINGGPASSAVAARLLDAALADTRRGVPPGRPDADGKIALYLRNADTPLGIDPILLDAADAAVVHAARLARLRTRIDPSRPTARRAAMVLDLEARSLLESAGVDPPADEQLDPTTFPNEELNAALSAALESRRPGAATALCVVLGDRGDASVLITGGGRASPLADALRAPHPAVRFAALRGIIGLKPSTAFPGSSRAPDVLIEFAGAGASRSAVVATPNLERSATIAGYLATLGVEGLATNRGEQAVELAESADVEMVLLDMGVLVPGVRETLFRLRRQPATGLAPVALLAAEGRLDAAKALAAEHRGVVAFARPHNAEAIAAIVDAMHDAAPAGWPTVDERAELARVARKWLAELLRQSLAEPTTGARATFYNLRARRGEIERVLAREAGEGGVVEGLAAVGTPESQLELLRIVRQSAAPLEARRAASTAFAASVERFGVLLTTDQITRQYDLYNASESADPATQQVLGSVLDTIEKKRESAASGRQ